MGKARTTNIGTAKDPIWKVENLEEGHSTAAPPAPSAKQPMTMLGGFGGDEDASPSDADDKPGGDGLDDWATDRVYVDRSQMSDEEAKAAALQRFRSTFGDDLKPEEIEAIGEDKLSGLPKSWASQVLNALRGGDAPFARELTRRMLAPAQAAYRQSELQKEYDQMQSEEED